MTERQRIDGLTLDECLAELADGAAASTRIMLEERVRRIAYAPHPLSSLVPTLLRMLESSGPWLDCPFCGSDDTLGKVEDGTEYHRHDCPLRKLRPR